MKGFRLSYPGGRAECWTQLGRAPRVYLAGPITSDPVGNLCRGIDLYDNLCDRGFDPYLPHFNIMCDERPYEFWMQQDMRWLAACDALLRWGGKSPGADREWVEAERLMLPRFRRPIDLIKWARSPIAWDERSYVVAG